MNEVHNIMTIHKIPPERFGLKETNVVGVEALKISEPQRVVEEEDIWNKKTLKRLRIIF